MRLKKLSVVLFASTFLCGCESPIAKEAEKTAVSKETKSDMKGNVATVSEPP